MQAGADAAAEKGPEVKGPRVRLQTSAGDILIGLYPDEAPLTVENFLAYVESGHYDGLVFHRVIQDFMIQAGGFEPDLTMREGGRPPIRNESDNGVSNRRGTIAMARTPDPHSASAQFFINHVDNPFLDYGAGDPTGARGPNQWGYAVFGEVLEGMDVVDAIAVTQTGVSGGMSDVPAETITILRATVEPS
jgi:cyclophilin family peptidyl-prolyl cis-trans isomerase